jgi:hypothetical protein
MNAKKGMFGKKVTEEGAKMAEENAREEKSTRFWDAASEECAKLAGKLKEKVVRYHSISRKDIRKFINATFQASHDSTDDLLTVFYEVIEDLLNSPKLVPYLTKIAAKFVETKNAILSNPKFAEFTAVCAILDSYDKSVSLIGKDVKRFNSADAIGLLPAGEVKRWAEENCNTNFYFSESIDRMPTQNEIKRQAIAHVMTLKGVDLKANEFSERVAKEMDELKQKYFEEVYVRNFVSSVDSVEVGEDLDKLYQEYAWGVKRDESL